MDVLEMKADAEVRTFAQQQHRRAAAVHSIFKTKTQTNIRTLH